MDERSIGDRLDPEPSDIVLTRVVATSGTRRWRTGFTPQISSFKEQYP